MAGGGGSSGEGFGGEGGRGVDPSDFAGGYGLEGGGAQYGGYGGIQGQGLGTGSEYSGFGGSSGGASAGGGGGVNWSGMVDRALAALAALGAQAHPLGAVTSPMVAGFTAKARGLPNVEIERAAMQATPLGQALSAVSRFGQGVQKGAIALGATGGPQPGSGAQPGSGGFGGLEGLDPNQAAAVSSLAERVFAIPAPKRAQVVAQLARGVPVFGASPGEERGNQ